MSEETKRALLSQAVACFGVVPLATQLHVPDRLLAEWIAGHASMPDRKLLALIDILDKIDEKSDG